MPGCILPNPAAALNGKGCKPSAPGFESLMYALHSSDVDLTATGNAYYAGDYILETLVAKAGATWLPIYALPQTVNYTEAHRQADGSVEGTLTFNVSPRASIGTTSLEQRGRALYLGDGLLQDNEGWIFLVKERGGDYRVLGVTGQTLTPFRRADGSTDNPGTADADIAVKTLVFSAVLSQSAPLIRGTFEPTPIAA